MASIEQRIVTTRNSTNRVSRDVSIRLTNQLRAAIIPHLIKGALYSDEVSDGRSFGLWTAPTTPSCGPVRRT